MRVVVGEGVGMLKRKAGERKRTVTVVIGTDTETVLNAIAAVLGAERPGIHWRMTDVVGACVYRGMLVMAKEYDLTLPIDLRWVGK